MHDTGFLDIALLFLLAAVLAVPLFRYLGLGAVLGYLAAGVAIGPHVLGLVPDPDAILAASEFGVVMLLFIIGLELSPARLWVMRRQVFGIGALQVFGSAALLGLGLSLLWSGWKTPFIVAMALALSSTAVGLQMLAERKELTAGHGRLAFAILLFQDIIVIPLLALIPLLGEARAAERSAPDWLAVGNALLAIAAVIVIGRWLLRHLFRAVARAQSVEVFTASALMVVAGTAWLMQSVGLSMGLGAFLAGVLLADSEFRHELESHIEPFKGLLLGLFFIAVGMTIDLQVVAQEPLPILAGVTCLLLLKSLVLFGVGRLGGLGARSAAQLAVIMAMGGEFAFVIFAEAFKAGLLDPALRDRLVVVVGLSMAATPPLVLGLGSWLNRHPEARAQREPDPIDDEHPRVIIAGFGRMGQIVGRLLRASKIPFTALENSPEQVDLSRRFGTKIYFGDPARPDLLRAAHAGRAELFVVTTDDPDANLRTVRIVRRLFPHVRILARARNRQHAFRLMDLGVDVVTRETFHSSIEMGRHALMALGLDADQASERTRKFAEHDEALLREQHLVYDDEAALVVSSRDALRDLEKLFEADEQPEESSSGESNPKAGS
ncbi:monovalent cation:proton antiporter-2 (CPA2) family protein [Pseudomarimonas salicorniae]|uniref:Monovalent cation:proton antiporter-2 (CPA2) family protein n=1 Tax=Pseudomarimonas salicorniae TaxID=2933270 RepID=A0ABT0GNM9_9GAMM|nr:monovalent cation:proton antiporter-2 (CPA2) family protein [Lysobacter sp. CAU 1642]MCK7595602.1 monovalent cation:proton antiporter-2 (CPA2) family protein [Lysobacter sp. CAU 1642]